MKKSFILLICLLSLLSFTSCKEEESPLLFSEVSVSNPEDIKMEYYSPDPCCVAKSYWITANTNASKITIKCTNANFLLFQNHKGETMDEYSSTKAKWTAKVENSNYITLTLYKITDYSAEEAYLFSEGFNVVAKTKDGLVSTGITLFRHPDYNHE